MRLQIFASTLRFLIVSIVLGVSFFAHAEEGFDPRYCRRHEAGQSTATSCGRVPSNWDHKSILYHFHGLGGDATSWDKKPAYQEVAKDLESQNKLVPVVVSVSFGNFWFLKDYETAFKPSFLQVFLKIQKEWEEDIFGSSPPAKRLIVGESMGGFNTLLLLTKSNLYFDKVAFLCPGFATVGPYSTSEEVKAYIKRNEDFIDKKRVYGVLAALKVEFPSLEKWEAHSPVKLVKTVKHPHARFFIMGNTRDEYGFGEGALLLRDELKSLGLKVLYEKVPGRHCVMNAKSITDFLNSEN